MSGSGKTKNYDHTKRGIEYILYAMKVEPIVKNRDRKERSDSCLKYRTEIFMILFVLINSITTC